MSLRERLASTLIGTPLQAPAESLKRLLDLPHRLGHPELGEIHQEEERSARFLAVAISPGMNCIDIGCHLGSVLNRMISLSPGGRHVAIEPLPHKAGWLRRKYPGVEVHQVALGDREADVEFFHNPGKSGFSGLRSHAGGEKHRIRVQCRRLDDVIPEGHRVDFIKLDVEGGEYFVLKGARRILDRDRPMLLFECVASGLEAFELAPNDLFSLITEELDYQVFLLKDWLWGAAPLDFDRFRVSMQYPFQAFNYVAAPRNRVPSAALPEQGHREGALSLHGALTA